ncbi:MAG: YfhO family protein [Oscillospiraceae bacterium]|nr:YfhO family protein [Oscillospiraceae bacterium]
MGKQHTRRTAAPHTTTKTTTTKTKANAEHRTATVRTVQFTPNPRRLGLFLTLGAYVLAFCIPIFIGLLMYRAMEIAPFGENSVLCMDLWGQYAPMYTQIAQSDSLSELLYSWNGAFGYNNWAQSAYYCNSIFWLGLRLVPLEHLISYINWICLLKLGCAGVTCLAYLRRHLKSRSVFLIGGAVAYSLCAYMLAFLSQPMWTDVLIFAPLVLLGMDRMLQEKKPLCYLLMLTLTICSSFYIGFAMCIFCCIYFAANALPVLQMGRNEEGKLRLQGVGTFGRMTGLFTVSSLLAGALSAPVILPVAKAISLTLASEAAFPQRLKWYGNVADLLRHMLSEQPLCVETTGVNLSIGMIAFLLLPLYFFNREISEKQRAANGIVLGFLGLSIQCNYLDFIWHGFHFPNQLPGRWTFLFSLFAVLLICDTVVHLQGLTLPRCMGGLAISATALYLAYNGIGSETKAELPDIYFVLFAIAVMLLLLAIIVELLRKAAQRNPESQLTRLPLRLASILCTAAMAAVCIYDSGRSYIHIAQFETHGTRVANGVSYQNNILKQRAYGEKWACDETTFYRVEANQGFTFNPSMIGGYHGMGYYSSTMRGKAFSLLQYLGNRVYAQNVSSVYQQESPVQNSLFGIRYHIDYVRSMDQLPCTNVVESDASCDIVENTTALSLAYAVSPEILDVKVTNEVRAIENQNKLLNAITGKQYDVFRKINTASFYYNNATLTEHKNWNANYFHAVDNAAPVSFHYSYVCDTDGPYYLEHNFRAGSIRITVNGKERIVDPQMVRFVYLGDYTAGTAVTVEATLENIAVGCVGMNLYAFDTAKWEQAYAQLSETQLQVEEFRNTHIRGTISLPAKQMVMTTIAQDGGWKVYCDGKRIEPTLVLGELICLTLPEGEHTLEFRYQVPGLIPGLLLCLAALLLCLLLFVPKLRDPLWNKLRSLKKAKPQPAEDNASAAEDNASSEEEEQLVKEGSTA